ARPEVAGEGGLAAAGRPGDEADVPRPFLDRQRNPPAEARGLLGGQVEQPAHLPDARRLDDGRLDGDDGVHGKESRMEPQRHRDTEKTNALFRDCLVWGPMVLSSLCLCASVVSSLFNSTAPGTSTPPPGSAPTGRFAPVRPRIRSGRGTVPAARAAPSGGRGS